MAQITLGQVSIINKGAWSSSTTYSILDMVQNRGGSFLCIKSHKGSQPGVASTWTTNWVSAAKGITSITSASSDSTVTLTITFSDGTSTTVSYSSSVGEGSIGSAQLASNAVTTAKINGQAVTTAKIADGAVTAAKIGSDVTYSTIGLSANQVRKIVIGTVTPTTTQIPNDGDIYLKYNA
jgi:hypothetical protein